MDRLSIMQRPRGYPVIRQHWDKLLFLHWPIPLRVIRPLVPASLEIDTWNGTAWIGLIPFTMWGVRTSFAPPLPGLSAFHELNVRTYVHRQDVPGVYFLSLDASLALAVRAARRFYHLPYYMAEMSLHETNGEISYHSRRIHKNAPPAEFFAKWRPGKPLPQAKPDSLAFFLTERYCFFTEHRQRLYRCRINHRSWSLHEARLTAFESTVLQSHKIPSPGTQPVLHHAGELSVDIWPLTPVEAFSRTKAALKRITPEVAPEPGRTPI